MIKYESFKQGSRPFDPMTDFMPGDTVECKIPANLQWQQGVFVEYDWTTEAVVRLLDGEMWSLPPCKVRLKTEEAK